MSFISWLSLPWGNVAETRERRETAASAQVAVPPEYAGLHNYLNDRYASLVVLTFEQIESLLGFPLPDAARTEQTWWTRHDRHTEAWVQTRRRATPNLLARNVAFERPL